MTAWCPKRRACGDRGGSGRDAPRETWLSVEPMRLDNQSTVVTVPTPRDDDLGRGPKTRGLRDGDLGDWDNSDYDRGRFPSETVVWRSQPTFDAVGIPWDF